MCVQTANNAFSASSSGSEVVQASTKQEGSRPDAPAQDMQQASQQDLQQQRQQQQPSPALPPQQQDGGAATSMGVLAGTATATSSRQLRLLPALPNASDDDVQQLLGQFGNDMRMLHAGDTDSQSGGGSSTLVTLATSEQAAVATGALQGRQLPSGAAPLSSRTLAEQQLAAAAAEQPADEQPADTSAGAEEDGSGHITLFFAKVPRSAPQEEVRQLFASFGGIVELNLFTEYEGAPASKGCGLVVMESSDARSVIDALDSKHTWPGMRSPMVVKLMNGTMHKRRKEEGPPYGTGVGMHPARASSSSSSGSTPACSSGRPGPFPTEQPPPGCEPDAYKLFVGNVPKRCTEQHLRPVFEAIGRVVELVVLRDRLTQVSKGSAFVWYVSRAEADMAVAQYHMTLVMRDPSRGSTGGEVPLVVRRAAARGRSGAAASAGTAYPYGGGYALPHAFDAAAVGARAVLLPPGLGGAAVPYGAGGLTGASWMPGLHGGAAAPATMQPQYPGGMVYPYQQQHQQQEAFMQPGPTLMPTQPMAQQYLQQPTPAPYMQQEQLLQGMQGLSLHAPAGHALQLHQAVSSMPLTQLPAQPGLQPASQVFGQPGSSFAVAAAVESVPQMMQPPAASPPGADMARQQDWQLQAGGAHAAGMLPASPLAAAWGPPGLVPSSSIQQHGGSTEAAPAGQAVQLQLTGQQLAAMGGRLQSITAMTGVPVSVVQQGGSSSTDALAPSDTCIVRLTGDAQQVASACQLLQCMLAEAAQQGVLQSSSIS